MHGLHGLHVSCNLHFGAAGVVAASQVAFVVVVGVVREIGVGAKVVGGWPKYSKEHGSAESSLRLYNHYYNFTCDHAFFLIYRVRVFSLLSVRPSYLGHRGATHGLCCVQGSFVYKKRVFFGRGSVS